MAPPQQQPNNKMTKASTMVVTNKSSESISTAAAFLLQGSSKVNADPGISEIVNNNKQLQPEDNYNAIPYRKP